MNSCEDRLRELSGRGNVLLASRATVALVAALRALDLPPGSEVLMPVTLCANPANAVRIAGFQPLFADIDPRTFNMDLLSASGDVSPQTKVLLAVPLFGHPLDCRAILDFAERHNLIVVEDAAQAVSLRYSDWPAGSLGICSIYSFGAGKIADAGGGAALLSDDPAFLARAQDHLRSISPASAGNTNRDRILSALGNLPHELQQRSELALAYRRKLDMPGVVHPDVPPGSPLWKYSVLLPTRSQRDHVTRALLAAGIEATNLYPSLAPYFPAARNSGAKFVAAQHVFDRIVNLPLWPQHEDMAERVAEVLRTGSS